MNLGINKEEARLIHDSLNYYFKQTKVPNLLLDMYPGTDLKGLMVQLDIIMKIGDEPIDKKYKNQIYLAACGAGIENTLKNRIEIFVLRYSKL